MTAANTVFEASKKRVKMEIKDVGSICEFFCKMRSLPSNEAFCERIFANMRLLFPDSRCSCKDDLIRAQTLIRMTLSLKRPYFEE